MNGESQSQRDPRDCFGSEDATFHGFHCTTPRPCSISYSSAVIIEDQDTTESQGTNQGDSEPDS